MLGKKESKIALPAELLSGIDYLLESLINVEAEMAVIGCIMEDNTLLESCQLEPDDFGGMFNRNIFHVIKDLEEKGKSIDLVMISSRAGSKRIEKLGGMTYITSLSSSVPSLRNFEHYVQVVSDLSGRRKAAQICLNVFEGVSNKTGQEAISDALESFVSLNEKKGEDDAGPEDGHIKHKLMDVFEDMQEDKGEISGMDTTFADLNKITSGMHGGELVIVGARPSVGKTVFALNLANGVAETGDVSAVFSLEMKDRELIKRMISSEGMIDAGRMKNPARLFNGTDNWERTTMAIGQLASKDIHIFDRAGVTIGYIWRNVRKLRRRYPGRRILVVIDYLQLIQGNPKYAGNRNLEVGEISRSLKLMARDLDVCVVALSQLSRGVEQRQDKRPMLSDLRDSGSIEQDADVITFLYRDDYYDKESEKKNIIEIIFAKNRNGPLGTVELAFLKQYSKFLSLDRSHQEAA